MARPKQTEQQKKDNAAKKAAKAVPKTNDFVGESQKNEVINQTLSDIVTPELEQGAIYNDGHPGFREDYLVIHCLLKKYQPKKLFEIGTSTGAGTNIICNALGDGVKVISLDINEEAHPGTKTGAYCNLPFEQVIADSLNYDFAQHKDVEAFFIDGAHEYKHVKHESKAAVASGAKLIIWHDADMAPVWEGITEVILKTGYKLYRVEGTRVAYSLK